ncbi:two pore domain potassium channel family protein [Planococcus halotolerans]|nr:two pore domain potassium channel family protein [Planococcus halotolerans]
MLSAILIGLTIVLMSANLYYFFSSGKNKRSYFQPSLFQKLFYTLAGITVGFGVLYYLLSFQGEVIRVGTEEGEDGGDNFLDFLYFSGVTMLSVGYGDLVPVGGARFFALIQAGIGLLLPTAFFIRAISEREESDGEGNKNGKEGQGNRSDKRKKDDKDDRQADEADD